MNHKPEQPLHCPHCGLRLDTKRHESRKHACPKRTQEDEQDEKKVKRTVTFPDDFY